MTHYVALFEFRKAQLGQLSPSETTNGFSGQVSVWMGSVTKIFVPSGTAGNRCNDRPLQSKVALPD
jgi:hypothetical protein